jgi:hypothetical protein
MLPSRKLPMFRSAAAFDIGEKALKQRVELSRSLPEGRVPESRQTITMFLPKIGVSDRFDVINVEDRLIAAVDDCDWCRTALDDPALSGSGV